MQKRFILTFAVAVLLGLAKLQGIPTEPATPPAEPATPPAEPATPPAEPATPPAEPATPPAEPATPPAEPATPPTEPETPPTEPVTPPSPPTEEEKQAAWLKKNEALAAGDPVIDNWKAAGCNLYDDFAHFSLSGLRGPFSVEGVMIDGTSKDLEVRFCGPVHQTKDNQDSKSSLVFAVKDGVRETRYTSGDTLMAYTETQRSTDEDSWDVVGIKYSAKESSEVCKAASTVDGVEVPAKFWSTEFVVHCGAESTIHYNSISARQDGECKLVVETINKAGCPTLEYSGFV